MKAITLVWMLACAMLSKADPNRQRVALPKIRGKRVLPVERWYIALVLVFLGTPWFSLQLEGLEAK